MSVHLWEAVAEPAERFPSCHCSTLVELASGDLLVGYYAGAAEARPDVAWVLARRRPGADRFDPLTVVADTPGKPEGNGILLEDARGRVHVIYGTMHGRLDGPPGPGVRWVTCDLRRKHSDDGGRTWSDVHFLDTELGHVPHSKAVRLPDGAWLFGTEYKDGHSRMWLSRDEGESWGVIGAVPGEPNQHPTLVARPDGTILALLRPSGRRANVLQSVSVDAGRTWSAAEPTALPCPHAAIDAVFLADGRIALAWNDNPERRNPLTLALSEDGGDTWPFRRNILTGEGSFHYPAIIQTRDGLLHVTLTNNRRTIDHVVLTPDWIAGTGDDLPPWQGSETVRTAG
jgi:predicted neuraminidase